MNLNKVNKLLHRDLGYFFAFLTIIYCISGLAINHASDWNPDFVVKKETIKFDLPKNSKEINEKIIKSEIKKQGFNEGYLMFDSPTTDKVKIYFKQGAIMCDLSKGVGEVEFVTKRHLLFEMNYLHRNPGGLWTIISDIFAISLLIISLTGLFVAQGKNGLNGRGKWLLGSGVVVTALFAMILI